MHRKNGRAPCSRQTCGHASEIGAGAGGVTAICCNGDAIHSLCRAKSCVDLMIDLALYQPDIAQNTGTLIRLCACLGTTLHIIEPAGFDMSDRNLKRAGMDYIELAAVTRHTGWSAFLQWVEEDGRRIVLATTHATTPFTAHAFAAHDVILMGRESAGVPDSVHARADVSLRIPMRPGLRSINLAVSAAMMLGEGLRQTGGFPGASLEEG